MRASGAQAPPTVSSFALTPVVELMPGPALGPVPPAATVLARSDYAGESGVRCQSPKCVAALAVTAMMSSSRTPKLP